MPLPRPLERQLEDCAGDLPSIVFLPAAARCVAIELMMIATLTITILQPSTCAGGRDWSMFVALLHPCHVFVLFDIAQVCWEDVLPRLLDTIQV